MNAAPDVQGYQGNRRKYNGGSDGVFGKAGRTDRGASVPGDIQKTMQKAKMPRILKQAGQNA